MHSLVAFSKRLTHRFKSLPKPIHEIRFPQNLRRFTDDPFPPNTLVTLAGFNLNEVGDELINGLPRTTEFYGGLGRMTRLGFS